MNSLAPSDRGKDSIIEANLAAVEAHFDGLNEVETACNLYIQVAQDSNSARLLGKTRRLY